ncbi:MAG: ATP-binding protein [Bacteroidetes bacterium]|nr:ATP-binding protein [Bacteroidota bacterium]
MTISELLSNEEIEKLRIDRVEEIDSCIGTILKTKNNIFMYGQRGVGKTFLLKTIYNETIREDKSVFPFFLNLFSLSRSLVDHGEYAFSSFLALEIITSIWTELYRKPHSELINRAISPAAGDSSLISKLNYLQTTYANLKASLFKMQFESEHNVGVKAIVSGHIKTNETESREYGQLLPFEIISYIKELQDFLNKKEKKIKLIALCDEANLMSEEWQKAVLSKHIDIFSNIDIQFVFVAGYIEGYQDLSIPDTFEYIFELHGMNKEHLVSLIGNHFPDSELKISQETLSHLYKSTKGNPRSVLEIASRVIRSDYKNNKLEISKHYIDAYIEEQATWSKAIPTRK